LLFYNISGNCANIENNNNAGAQIRSMSYEYYICPDTQHLLLVLVAGDKAGILTFVTFSMVVSSSSSLLLDHHCEEEHYPQYLHTQKFHIGQPRQQQHGVISKARDSTTNDTNSSTGILGIAFHRERKFLALCTSNGLVQVYSFDHLMLMILMNFKSINHDVNETTIENGSCNVQLMNTNVAAGLLIWSKQNVGNTPIRSILFDPINDTILYGGYDKKITIITITNNQWTIARELHVNGTVRLWVYFLKNRTCVTFDF
jgi:hypothetical protein